MLAAAQTLSLCHLLLILSMVISAGLWQDRMGGGMLSWLYLSSTEAGGNAQMSCPNYVSAEATEGGFIGIEGIRVLKVVTDLGSGDDGHLLLILFMVISAGLWQDRMGDVELTVSVIYWRVGQGTDELSKLCVCWGYWDRIRRHWRHTGIEGGYRLRVWWWWASTAHPVHGHLGWSLAGPDGGCWADCIGHLLKSRPRHRWVIQIMCLLRLLRQDS